MENKVSQLVSVDEKKGTTYNPLVSIVTPVLNSIKYLEECIQNLLNQSYPYIEHIFIDGGSTDGTLDLLTSYKTRYPDRIRFISEPDKSVGEAVNKGWGMAKGEILGWIDSDDIYELDAVQAVVEFFRANPDAYVVFGGGHMINERGEVIRTYPMKDFDLEETIKSRTYIHTPPSAFYKREVIERVGGFPTVGNDLDFHIRVGKVFPIHRIDKLLFKVRLHKDSISLSKDPNKRRLVRESFQGNYILCRQHGGSIFSPRSRRYFMFEILDRLRLYDLVVLVVLVKLRRYSFINKLLLKLGIVG